jgi:hypothetical protein
VANVWGVFVGVGVSWVRPRFGVGSGLRLMLWCVWMGRVAKEWVCWVAGSKVEVGVWRMRSPKVLITGKGEMAECCSGGGIIQGYQV